jgi:hypothetical protein
MQTKRAGNLRADFVELLDHLVTDVPTETQRIALLIP